MSKQILVLGVVCVVVTGAVIYSVAGLGGAAKNGRTAGFTRAAVVVATETAHMPAISFPPSTPTAGVLPAVATLVPLGALPTLGALYSVEPSERHVRYQDPNLGFSFEYPANWYLEGDSPKTAVQMAMYGAFATVRSYVVIGMVKGGGVPERAFKMEVTVSSHFAQYGTIENWFKHHAGNLGIRPETALESAFPNLERFQVDGVPAIRLRTKNFDGGDLVAFGSGDWLYVIAAYPGTSVYISTFDEIIATFHMP